MPIESTARLHRAPAPVTPERRRWFQEIVAEQELRSADGESLVRQLVAAGLSAQDAEEAVRRYFIQVGGCVLDAIEAPVRKINESFEEFFADMERDLQDPSQARGLLFGVLEIEDQFDYCDLVASQAAGLR